MFNNPYMCKSILHSILFSAIMAVFTLQGYAQAGERPYISKVWVADLGNGTYKNPVLHADYSDPDVVRVGDDFYLAASSFNCTPGLPILHSRDLVNWVIVNHAIKNLPHSRYAAVQAGCGVWAPAIRFHAGKFWIFFPMPDEGIYVTTATDPAGTWTEPHLLQAGKGLIDPCPLWDDDGQAYLVHAYAGSRAGIKHRLRVCPMAPDGSRLLGEGQIVFHENQDFHYKRLPSSYTPAQPILNAIYADFHAALWKVMFRQNRPGNFYDPNWFTYGPRGVFNDDNPNIGYDVHTGWDLN